MILKQPKINKQTGQNKEENATINEQQKYTNAPRAKKVLRK